MGVWESGTGVLDNLSVLDVVDETMDEDVLSGAVVVSALADLLFFEEDIVLKVIVRKAGWNHGGTYVGDDRVRGDGRDAGLDVLLNESTETG